MAALQAKNIADADDSTSNMRQYSEQIQVCAQNMNEFSNQILSLALKLKDTSFGPEMEPIINELSILGEHLFSGKDINGNGLNEPIEGECSAFQIYDSGWNMVDMPIFIGPDRIPPNGK
jgi:hypothetical protein